MLGDKQENLLKNWVDKQPRGKLDGPAIKEIGQYEGTHVQEQIGKKRRKQLSFPLLDPGKMTFIVIFKKWLETMMDKDCLQRGNFGIKFRDAHF
jgi:hypothetical protein